MDETTKEQVETDRLSRIGMILTFLYFVIVSLSLAVLINYGWIAVSPLSLNEAGDLLAGLFGPLAIFWVVLGFFQQGKELRNSVNTLRLQARELALSVEQQRELVLVTRDTLEFERAMAEQSMLKDKESLKPRPVITMRGIMAIGLRVHYDLEVTNAGNSVSNAQVTAKYKDRTIAHLEAPYWEKGQALKKSNFFLSDGNLEEHVDVKIEYKNDRDALNTATFRIFPNVIDWSKPFNVKPIQETIGL